LAFGFGVVARVAVRAIGDLHELGRRTMRAGAAAINRATIFERWIMNSKVEALLRHEANAATDPSALALRAAQMQPAAPVFAMRHLSVLTYANGFTLWHYKAGKHRLEAVTTGNYFADASDMLAVGDLLMVSAADGARIVVVASHDHEHVALAPLA
jgi:hypothetical protein